MESYTILLVEDDELIGKLVKKYLKQAGYKVIWAKDGASAKDFYSAYKIDAVILDLNLPFVDGLQVAKFIKSQANTPILMLTARTTEIDELNGFNAGADDYIKKPFSPHVLLARLKNALSKIAINTTQTTASKVKLGKIALDLNSFVLSINNQTYQLTKKQALFINALLNASGGAVSRDALLQAINSKSKDPRLIDAMVKNLRKILPKDFILAARGIGYKINIKYLNE